jgi:hypothetical protein
MVNLIYVLHAPNLWLHPHTHLHLLEKIKISQQENKTNTWWSQVFSNIILVFLLTDIFGLSWI